MQNKEILEALTKAIAENGYSKYSFVIDNNQINKIIGGAKDKVVVVRSNTYTSIYGWESSDSALMFSCIKKIYKEDKLIFDCTK